MTVRTIVQERVLLCPMLLAVLALPVFNGAAQTNSLPPENRIAVTNLIGWSTNGPAIYATYQISTISSNLNSQITLSNQLRILFDHYAPNSLNNVIWTNFAAHTNGRNAAVWSVRSHPADWPTNPPLLAWNTNCLMWGMKGLTALSPCWAGEANSGQVPITALTRRHGYTRGHGMGSDGFRTDFAGRKVWFLAADNTVVQATVRRAVVRTFAGGAKRDYSILLFSKDLPASIEPLRVVSAKVETSQYPRRPSAPHPLFKTEQSGSVSAEVPGLSVNTWKGGDSGSPDMLPMPGELVFLGGRSTSGPSPEMQADMDELCRKEGLNPKRYQMQWVDLSGYPSY